HKTRRRHRRTGHSESSPVCMRHRIAFATRLCLASLTDSSNSGASLWILDSAAVSIHHWQFTQDIHELTLRKCSFANRTSMAAGVSTGWQLYLAAVHDEAILCLCTECTTSGCRSWHRD